MIEGAVIFRDWECNCPHSPAKHDDGFGCTEPECECIAGWDFA